MTPPRRDTLSVVIPTRNAGQFIGECLESVRFADEIIVVDMHSTDDTAEICARYPQLRLIEREDYIFGNVNHGFDVARCDWTMRIDSDERITPELAAEIDAVLRDPPADVTGFFFNQRLVVLGYVLRHGRGAGTPVREMMFRTGQARYAVRSEHESLETEGRWVRLQGFYVHLNYSRVADYLVKTNYYTTKDVDRATLPSRRPTLRAGVTETARAFYLYYLKQRGFRDGWPGFVDAGMMSVYQFVQWAKLVERWHAEQRPGQAR